MPRSLLSSRYNSACSKPKNKMFVTRRSRIWDPLKHEMHTRSMMKNSKDFRNRLHSNQLSLLQSKDWLTSDLIPFTVRYELEQRHNIALMAHYGDDDNNIDETTSSSEEDSNDDDKGYFSPKPRKINFDDLDIENQNDNAIDVDDESASKQKKNKLSDEDANQKLICNVCSKTFEKRWALTSHMLSHSGDKPFRCTYKTCAKSYADRSNLRAHQRSKKHHSWKISCNQCTKPFSEQRYLNLHSLSACRKYLAGVSKKINP